MADKTNIAFLGKGWSFPPQFNRATKTIEMSEGVEDIKQSLEIILATRVGERAMHPDFGCNLERLLFESLNLTLERNIKDMIQTAILKYETRIKLEEIDFHSDKVKGCIYINLNFLIRTTNTRSNIVYPYYLKEGTNI